MGGRSGSIPRVAELSRLTVTSPGQGRRLFQGRGETLASTGASGPRVGMSRLSNLLTWSRRIPNTSAVPGPFSRQKQMHHGL
ncbi:MAG: hypothetical protein DIJKHBIC_04805 [Thermoanaerobaculia bacterium]|nr:hypothetical protein [Thermoanaerobaculia bacterium]